MIECIDCSINFGSFRLRGKKSQKRTIRHYLGHTLCAVQSMMSSDALTDVVFGGVKNRQEK